MRQVQCRLQRKRWHLWCNPFEHLPPRPPKRCCLLRRRVHITKIILGINVCAISRCAHLSPEVWFQTVWNEDFRLLDGRTGGDETLECARCINFHRFVWVEFFEVEFLQTCVIYNGKTAKMCNNKRSGVIGMSDGTIRLKPVSNDKIHNKLLKANK